MTDNPNKLNIFGQVRELSRVTALGFCATMLERQVPNFDLFCSVTATEGNEQMNKALNQVWLAFEAAQKRQKIKTNFALLRDKVEEVTPDSADYDNFGVYPAIDCAMAMVATLNLLSREDEAGAVAVSKLSQGSVEAVILATEGDVDNQTIKQHPLMQREIEFQTQLLERLETQNDSKQSLQSFAIQDRASNIGIAIEPLED